MADHLDQDWTLIVNPRAGNGRAGRHWARYRAALAEVLPRLEIHTTHRRGEASELAAAAVRAGRRYFIAVGGDGTHHEVVNGLARAAHDQLATLHYALLPIGTGNDWIRTSGTPRRFTDWLATLRAGHFTEQTIGRVQYQQDGQHRSRYFANMAGMAYSAFVVREIQQQQPARSGKLLYLWHTLRCLFRYRPQRVHLLLDGQAHTERVYTLNVGIGRYAGGGMLIVPHANPAADSLAVTYISDLSIGEVLLNLRRFYDRTLANYDRAVLTHARRIEVRAAGDGPILLEADGEFLGQTPLTIDLAAGRLRFLTQKAR
jgi:YegS/Rv2252/BmrU family lipid kinase